MFEAPTRKTAYSQYVNSNLPARVLEGEGLYNYHELAALVGLKPTQHFRRRVNHLVNRGVLKLTPTFTLRGGIENRFEIGHTGFIGDLPF